MKSAVVTDAYKVEIKDTGRPVPGDDEVLIKVCSVGLCGSDLHLYKGTHAFRKPPAVLGHELAGEIIEIGKDVQNYKPGDRVTVEPHVPCMDCEPCRDGNINLCLNKKVPGTPAWTGSFVEYFNAPENCLHRLADDISYECGTLIEPLAVAVHAIRRIKTKPARSLAILGSGSVGLLTLAVALKSGFDEVYCTDVSPFNLKSAEKLGAKLALNARDTDCAAAILKATGGRGVDAAVIAAGAPSIIDQASEMTRRAGDIVLVAMITEKFPVYSYSLVFKEQALYGAMTYNHDDFLEAAALVNGGLDMKPFITHTLPMSEAQKALATLDSKNEDTIKIVLHPGE